MGIDIGTTSIKWSFKHSDSSLSYGQTFNPQMGAGPEVMSRLSFAALSTQNQDLLHKVLLSEVLNIINLQTDFSSNICITGNPAMIYFLLRKNLAGISVAPYSLEYTGGRHEALESYDSEVYVPSLFSPFVGADASAGLTYILEAYQPDFPFLFADFGTNGEIVLGISPDKFLCTSIALGPALEGIGLRHGSPYKKGVASRFSPTSSGIEAIGSWTTDKISGSGYISLLANLIRLKNISSGGHFKEGNSPLAFKIFSEINDKGLRIKKNLYLHPRDIEEILKVKAAFTLGVSFLCHKGSITHDMIKSIYIGGALGEHTSLDDLETLGFFPPGSANKSEVVGNTSLKGALLMAESPSSREHNKNLAFMVKSLNLAANNEYMAESFIRHMVFEYPLLRTRSK
ncbi:MAG: ASKHA domain-containing protein [Desulfonatronovibrio sp.]